MNTPTRPSECAWKMMTMDEMKKIDPLDKSSGCSVQ